MAVIGSLSVKLGLVTVEWDQATKKAKQDAKDLQKAFDDLTGNVKTLYGHWKTLGGALSLSAVGFASLVNETLQFADAVSDLAKGFDISIAKTLQFREAIKSSGGNAEGASKMLSTLFSKIEDARGGNEAAIAQFQKLGIGFKELVSLSPEQSLNRVFQAIANIGNTYERVKAVKEMLGKAGIGIEVDAVAQKLGMSTAQYQAYAKSIENVAKVNDDLAATFDNLKIAFADMIAPFTREGVVSIEKFKAAMVALTTGVIIGGLTQLVALTAKLIALWKEGAKIQIAITALGGSKGILQLGAATAAYFAALQAFDIEAEQRRSEASRTVTGVITDQNGQPINQPTETAEAENSSRRELIAAQAKLDLAKKQLGFLREEGQIKFDALRTDKYTTQLREANLILSREIATAESQRAQALSKENLSEEQKGIIQQEYQTAIAAANEKNKQATRLIRAERDIANKEELAAAKIKEQLAARQLQYIKLEGQIKVDALTSDRYNIQLRESQLSLVREIASIESQREQSLNKQNLTAQQRKIIDDEYQASVDAAYEKHLQNGKRINAEREREIRLIGVQIEAARKTEAFDIQRIRLEERRFTMSDFAYKVSLEELNVRQRIADLEQQIIDAQNRMGAGKVFEAEKERITDLIEAEKKLSEFRMHSVAMEEYRRRSFREGWSTAMNNYMEESTNAARVAGSMFSSVIGNMESALDKFARTGKLKFSDLAKSIIQDIIAIHLKAQASKVFSMIAQSVGFGFSGTAVGQSQFSLAYGLPSSSGLGLSARANGGDISSGQPYLVGERGPELVVPRNSGTVIPNHALAGAMGGQVINYNGPIIQNMNAIDTQSGIAFLSKNKQAVWAANQSAQRSLPVSR
jgi:lambda family phage tail tape measure protein